MVPEFKRGEDVNTPSGKYLGARGTHNMISCSVNWVASIMLLIAPSETI